MTAIPYFGGKTPYVKWLYQHFPTGVHLVDAMCGSATVSINANPMHFPLITINDLNSEVINFFNILRNDQEEFIRQIMFTPFSREEFYAAAVPTDLPIERARRFYIRASQGYAGMGSQNAEKGWGYECSVINKYNNTVRNHYRVTTWNNKLEYLHLIADRLKNMQIENRSVFELLQQFNRPGILIYLDPPYLRRTRNDNKRYKHEFTDLQHTDLIAAANNLVCHCAISGYDDVFYNDLLTGWYKTLSPVKMTNTAKVPRQECLWTNYDPRKLNKLTLFDA